ncbi:MAG: hypothetical protein ACXABY_05275 [Candidatus Thorarchaeota archaeon]
MSSDYTRNHLGAIATLFAIALWGLTATGAGDALGRLSATQFLVFGILSAIAWILIPLYLYSFRWSFLVGILVIIIALVGMAFGGVLNPTAIAWYQFTEPVYDLTHLLVYIIGVANIYFSYARYKELG